MAPAKVLQFLDVLLGCKHGKSACGGRYGDGKQLFWPLLHNLGPSPPPGPWSFFRNIKVQHNCCPSYGLLLRLKAGGSWLCYSGDTRPCASLIAACRHRRREFPPSSSSATGATRRAAAGGGGGDDFLLVHEATFADWDRAQAEKKKHSTVSEAISVGSRIEASRVLLTHFSQRYLSVADDGREGDADDDHPPSIVTNNKRRGGGGASIPVGFAMDGFRFTL